MQYLKQQLFLCHLHTVLDSVFLPLSNFCIYVSNLWDLVEQIVLTL